MFNDKQLIQSLGGPANVAKTLGYDKLGGVQRVNNWMSRGIPSKVKLEHPEIFLRSLDELNEKLVRSLSSYLTEKS